MTTFLNDELWFVSQRERELAPIRLDRSHMDAIWDYRPCVQAIRVRSGRWQSLWCGLSRLVLSGWHLFCEPQIGIASPASLSMSSFRRSMPCCITPLHGWRCESYILLSASSCKSSNVDDQWSAVVQFTILNIMSQDLPYRLVQKWRTGHWTDRSFLLHGWRCVESHTYAAHTPFSRPYPDTFGVRMAWFDFECQATTWHAFNWLHSMQNNAGQVVPRIGSVTLIASC